jgi:hypothetical protein
MPVYKFKEIISATRRVKHLFGTPLYFVLGFISMLHLLGCSSSQSGKGVTPDSLPAVENASLKLPEGFSATIVADSVGKARHLAINSKEGIYIKLAALKNGKGIIYLRDTNGDGKADEQTAFGDYGGTGMYIRDNYLYASSNEAVYR